jgi:hypothetical protein
VGDISPLALNDVKQNWRINRCMKCWTRMARKRIAWLEAPVWELEDGLEAEWTEEALIYLGNNDDRRFV